jgi:hypothetical protein
MPAFYSDTALSLCTMISMLRSELGFAVRIRILIFASNFFPLYIWRRHDIQHNDTQNNDIQHNDTQHKGLVCETQHKQH